MHANYLRILRRVMDILHYPRAVYLVRNKHVAMKTLNWSALSEHALAPRAEKDIHRKNIETVRRDQD
jgi:hypothetical protein